MPRSWMGSPRAHERHRSLAATMEDAYHGRVPVSSVPSLQDGQTLSTCRLPRLRASDLADGHTDGHRSDADGWPRPRAPRASSATRGRHMVEWTPPAGRATRAKLAVTVGLLRNALHGWHRLAVQHRLPLPPLRARVLSRAVRRWSASADRELQQGVMMGAAQYKSRRAHIAWAWWLIRLETSTDATAVLERVAEAAGTAIAAASAAATAVAAIGHGGGPADEAVAAGISLESASSEGPRRADLLPDTGSILAPRAWRDGAAAGDGARRLVISTDGGPHPRPAQPCDLMTRTPWTIRGREPVSPLLLR